MNDGHRLAKSPLRPPVNPVISLNHWLQRSPEGNVTRDFTWVMAQTGTSNQAVHHATAKCRYKVQKSES